MNKFNNIMIFTNASQVPINAMIMRDVLGAVDGTRRNVDLLMENNGFFFFFLLFLSFIFLFHS